MSNATNATPICPRQDDSTGTKGLKTLAYCIVMVIALVGNFSIAYIVFKTKDMRRTINFFIANMALSDFLQVIFVHPRLITEVYWGRQRWLVNGKFGMTLCKLDLFLVDVSTAVSVQCLVLIAVDRFNAVVFPLRPPLFSSKVRRIVIPCTWLVAVGLHLPYLLGFRLVEAPSGTFCLWGWEEAFGPSSSLINYYIALFITLALIPFTLMALLYSIIIVTLKRHRFPGQQSVNVKEIQRRHKRDRNVLNMALAIVVGFALCWGPLNVYAFLRFFVWEPSCTSRIFNFIAFFLAYSSSAVNPCVCFIFSENYRKAFKTVFGTRCLCKCKFPCFGPLCQKSWTLHHTETDPSSTPDMQGMTLTSIA